MLDLKNKKVITEPVDRSSTGSALFEMGGQNKADFNPEANMMFWGEDSLSIQHPLSGYTSDVQGEKVALSTTDTDLQMYMLDPSRMEFGLLVKTNKVNQWIFNLPGWENFIFYKQPDFSKLKGATRVRRNGETYIDIVIGGVTQRMISENMCGGYAVYHKSKRNNQYLAGKVLNIPRPQLIDAKGQTSWGEIDIIKGEITVTADPAWLKTATYPVFVDPDFGYQTGGSAGENLNTARCYGNSDSTYFHTASTGDTITSYTAYVYTATAIQINFSAYSVSAGLPSSRLASTATEANFSVNTGEVYSWETTNTVSHALSNGVDYTICTNDDTTGLFMAYDTGGGNNDSINTTDADLPASWTHAAYDARIYSMYATYTAGGGGSASLYSNHINLMNSGA